MARPSLFIDGDQGTTGLQIFDRLRHRTDLRIVTLPAEDRKNDAKRAEAINDCDFAMLCLPDQAARDAVGFIRNAKVRVIDASSAHRIAPGWTYGFPEMDAGQARKIAGAQRVTNPGCYPTGAVGLLRPLVSAGLLPADYPAVIHAVSGYSGGGRAAVEAHEADQAPQSGANAFQVYGLQLEHKHTPEIQHHAALSNRPFFVPAYGAYRQGIVLTIPLELRLLPAAPTGEDLYTCLAAHYAGTRHVTVLPPGASEATWQLNPQALNDTNDMQLGVFVNARRGQVLLSAVFDNLGKGASGAAVQNLDLMLQ